jgi:hypothetical protein
MPYEGTGAGRAFRLCPRGCARRDRGRTGLRREGLEGVRSVWIDLRCATKRVVGWT